MFLTDRKEVVERMSRLPRTVGNKLSFEKVYFSKTTKESAGKSLEFITYLDPDDGIFPHRHTYFTEKFEIIEGELTLSVNGERILLKANEAGGTKSIAVTVPPYLVHSFWNETDLPIRFKITMEIAGDFEPFVRVGYGMEDDSLTYNFRRMPAIGKYKLLIKCLRAIESILGVIPRNILLAGLLGKMGGTYLPMIPIFLQKIIIGLLALIAYLTGKNKIIEKYYLGSTHSLEGNQVERSSRLDV